VEHIDDEALALLALGEQASASDAEHLQGCALCSSRLAELAETVTIARSLGPDDQLVPPPSGVWAAIQEELKTPDAVIDLETERRSRRPRTWLLMAAAAVVGVIAGGAVTAGVINAGSSQDVVASARLAPIGDSGLSGIAQVANGADGALLTVDIPGLPASADGYYEVWMATPDAKTMVAVGTISPGHQASLTLPAGMSTADFPLVDVSLEHFDGNTGHSAQSVVRGQLQV
jgi:anti-sigma-K factor RskA